jgi:hypothetical protein
VIKEMTITEEIWKEVKGHEGVYEVSNLGLVRSLPRTEKSNVGERVRNGKVLSSRNTKGYKSVVLCKDGRQTFVYVHRLVAQIFIPNPENKPEVNHIDGDKTNNEVENLEWCTKSENQKHSYANGLKQINGELHPRSILTEKDVRQIRKRYVKNSREYGTGALAKEYKVSRDAIYDVVTNRSWKGVL